MGFFSQNCNGCSHSLLSLAACDPINFWMNEVVVIQPDGTLITGRYDGYGGVNEEGVVDYEVMDRPGYVPPVGHEATVWHRACWEVAGEPRAYAGPSPHSEDQGWWFNPDDHKMPDPRGT